MGGQLCSCGSGRESIEAILAVLLESVWPMATRHSGGIFQRERSVLNTDFIVVSDMLSYDYGK
jgi:hypothetical protein